MASCVCDGDCWGLVDFNKALPVLRKYVCILIIDHGGCWQGRAEQTDSRGPMPTSDSVCHGKLAVHMRVHMQRKKWAPAWVGGGGGGASPM